MSPDAGTSWEQWTRREDEIGGYPDGFVFRPSDPKVIFMTAAHDAPGTWRTTHFAGARISRSTDGGRSWEILRNGLPDRLQASIEAFCLEEAGSASSIFAATTSGEIFCSEDLGEHWNKIISGLAPISKAGHYQEPGCRVVKNDLTTKDLAAEPQSNRSDSRKSPSYYYR